MTDINISGEIPPEDRILLSHVKGPIQRIVLFGQLIRSVSEHPFEEVSVSDVLIESEKPIVISATAVTFGPRADIFRLAISGPEDPYSIEACARSTIPIDHPANVQLEGLRGKWLHPAIVSNCEDLEVQLASGTLRRAKVTTDSSMILFSTKGIKLLIRQDERLALNLKVTTSPSIIEAAVSESSKIVLI